MSRKKLDQSKIDAFVAEFKKFGRLSISSFYFNRYGLTCSQEIKSKKYFKIYDAGNIKLEKALYV